MGETHSTNRKKKQKTPVPTKPGQKEESKVDTVDFQISAGDFVKSKSTQFRNEYKIGEVLGSGAFGEVRKVTHRATGMTRAAKILKKDAIDPEQKARMIEEVKILSTLDHAHIMRIYEMFEDSKHYYIISEFLEGGELFDRIIANSHFSERDAAVIMQQILSAIAYCHKHNIVHRDIKPENLVYESKKEDANLKLIDFGTAKIFRSEEALRETHGTPYYIAPEILNKNYTEKCDVWSCGVVMYILLSGLPPFNGSNDQNILKRVKAGKYDFNNKIWTTISDDAKKLITRMLEFNPTKRCSAQEALNDPWFQIVMEKKAINAPLARETLSNLQKFGFESKLQEATWVFLVSYFATKEEKEDLLETFKALDIDHDGQLTKEELTKGYMNIMGMTAEQAKEEAESVMKSIDTNKSGSIDYTEFVNATISKNHLLKNERLQAAFKVFDRNGDGVISAEEMRFLFNEGKTHGIPEDVWGKWISQVDKNSDGGISFEEFKEMMISLMTKKL